MDNYVFLLVQFWNCCRESSENHISDTDEGISVDNYNIVTHQSENRTAYYFVLIQEKWVVDLLLYQLFNMVTELLSFFQCPNIEHW